MGADNGHWIPFNRVELSERDFALIREGVSNAHAAGDGPLSHRAEAMLEAWHGIGRSLLAPSCTHALELCARLLHLGVGDEVIVPSFTFTSTAGAFALQGAQPVFVDVRDDTLNIDVDSAKAAITPRTRAICIVHYAGVAASPDRFRDLCAEHGLYLIEDNAHGLLGSFRGQPLGTFGALSTMSFHETKNISCGEGGALHINADHFLERAEILRQKGTDRSKFFRGEIDKYSWVDVGSSWILSDLLAAVLVGQLERREEIQKRRLAIWNRYAIGLKPWAEAMEVRLPVIHAGVDHPAHLFHLRLPTASDRSRFIAHLKSAGVNAVFHYQALNTSKVGVQFGGFEGQCPIAEQAAETLVRLPLHLHLSDDDVERVISATTSFTPN